MKEKIMITPFCSLTKAEFQELIAQHIRDLRVKSNQTQSQLAMILRISSQYYSQLERGEKTFTLDRLMDICAIYNVPLISLLSPAK